MVLVVEGTVAPKCLPVSTNFGILLVGVHIIGAALPYSFSLMLGPLIWTVECATYTRCFVKSSSLILSAVHEAVRAMHRNPVHYMYMYMYICICICI